MNKIIKFVFFAVVMLMAVSASAAPMRGTPATIDSWLAQKSSTATIGTSMSNDGYTGLIVDCRGLGLRTAMSPVIWDAAARPIYGNKNLDYDEVTHRGVAGYTYDVHAADRAGSRPLVVKALAVVNHNSSPVISVADANRILIVDNGFLSKMNVVFIR